jgi:hypothetical protein
VADSAPPLAPLIIAPAKAIDTPKPPESATPDEAKPEAVEDIDTPKPPAGPSRYFVHAQFLGPHKRGDELTESQLRSLGVNDDRLLELQLTGALTEIPE